MWLADCKLKNRVVDGGHCVLSGMSIYLSQPPIMVLGAVMKIDASTRIQ